jgi:glycosyltransferase involved in cell wall biosynthesis
MNILFLTQYYPPEIGAPQNRLHELALRLKKSDINVEVLTAMPNYPKMEIFENYKVGKIKSEQIDGIQVYRSKIFVSQSKGILARLLNYFSFVWTSYWRGRKLKADYDFILVESPPLFLAYSAMALSKKLKAKLIFNVSDLWPESAEKLNIVTNKTLLSFAYRLEKRAYERSTLITGQTSGIVSNITERFPHKRVYCLPNGVDLQFYDPNNFTSSDFRAKNNFSEEQILFFYGGILGYAQGLEIILMVANKITNPQVQFVIQGAGPEKDKLLALKAELKLSNVHFLNPVPKNEMPFVLRAVDVALVPLKKLELFEGAIPSKIFEALAMEKALLLGVDGEARQHFIERGNAGLFFEPENVEDLIDKVNSLASDKNKIKEMGKNGRSYVDSHFNRNKIASDFIQELKNN